MNDTITYEVSPKLQKESMQAYFRHVALKKKWVGVLAFLVAGCLICLLRPSPPDLYIGVGLGAVGFVLLLTWIKAYHTHMKVASDAFDLHQNKMVTVTLGEQNITVDRITAKQQTEWSKITRVVDAGDFLVLLSGKLPVGNLPKEFLSEDQIAFIRSRAKT